MVVKKHIKSNRQTIKEKRAKKNKRIVRTSIGALAILALFLLNSAKKEVINELGAEKIYTASGSSLNVSYKVNGQYMSDMAINLKAYEKVFENIISIFPTNDYKTDSLLFEEFDEGIER